MPSSSARTLTGSGEAKSATASTVPWAAMASTASDASVSMSGRRRPLIETLASEAVDAMAAQGTVDAVADFASPLPVKVLAELLGIPAAAYTRFREGSDLAVASLPATDPD